MSKPFQGQPGNRFQKEIDELLKGLQDGSLHIQRITRNINPGSVTPMIQVEIVDISALSGSTGATGATNPQYFFTPQSYAVTAAPSSAVMGGLVSAQSPWAAAPLGSGPPTGHIPGKAPRMKTREGTEPIIGYRDFLIADSVSGFVLMSRNKSLWRQREKTMAYCNGNIYAAHDAPHLGCECGIYAFSTPANPALKATDVAWAEVALWGEVLVCQDGYRAQYAYPLSIFLKDTKTLGINRVRDELEQGYGVPVFLVEERQGKTAADVMGEMVAKSLAEQEQSMTLTAEDMDKLTKVPARPRSVNPPPKFCLKSKVHKPHFWEENDADFWCPGKEKL